MTLGRIHSHASQEVGHPMTAHEEGHKPSALPEQPAGLLLLGVWFGLLTGLAEASIRALQWFFQHKIIFLSPDVVWMAPLADVFIFAASGLIFFLTALRWPRLASLGIASMIFSFLGFLSLLFMQPPMHRFTALHPSTALLLAAGVAVQTGRLIAAHPYGFNRLVRRTIGWMVALVVGLAVVVHGWQGLAERRALAQLPPAAPDAPNVLLIVLDTVRAQNLSLYGYGRPTTPQLERLAKTGVRFERAFSTAPWTLPSHASILTGRWAHELSADWQTPLDATYSTLAEVFSAQGYLAAGFCANGYCGQETGLNRGFVHYEDYLVSPGQIVLSSSLGQSIAWSYRFRRLINNYQWPGRKTAAEVNDSFLRWLSHKDQRPFIAFLNYLDAHNPYLPPEPFDAMYGSKKPGRKPFFKDEDTDENWKLSQYDIQAEMDAYDGSIAYLDHQLSQLFGELQKRNLLENTLVIITSDHGEQFGEHGIMGHAPNLYLPSLHVPLLISFPSRVPAGEIVREPVTLRDLPATVVDLLNLEGEARFPGASLARYWDGTRHSGSPVAEPLLSEVTGGWGPSAWAISKGNMKSLIAHRHQYIKNGDGREELYEFENDPLEKHDLARSEEGSQALEQFRTSLETVLQRTGVHLVNQP